MPSQPVNQGESNWGDFFNFDTVHNLNIYKREDIYQLTGLLDWTK